MGFGSNMPPEPHTPKWCEQNPNRCKDNSLRVSIQSEILTTLLIIAGILLVLNALKIINMKTLFNKVSTFLWGEKSFRWGELKVL